MGSPILNDAQRRRNQIAEAAKLVREWRVTPETTLDDLDLTVRTYNSLARMGVATVGDILSDRLDLAELDQLSQEHFEIVMQEACGRLVAGGIDENILPEWLTKP